MQVTAIIVLLGLRSGHSRGEISSKIGEVFTGEGKSIILAVLAIMFALNGRRTSIACYSQYLVERDEQSFAGLMTRFGVREKIKYQTFNSVCEAVINPLEEMTFSSWVEKQLFSNPER